MEDKDRTLCRLCGKKCEHLGSHISKAHKTTAKEYKEEFGLPYNMSLISLKVLKKKQEKFEEDREKYLKNLSLHGSKFHFKKGKTGKRRISERERREFIARIAKVNKEREPEVCPCCNMEFKNLDSHLYNKHNLLRIK